MLTDELMQRRDRAAQRHDRALDRFPDRAGATFERELDAVIEELCAVCAQIGGDERGAEVVRSFTWLADACFDRGLGRDPVWLEKGRGYYLRAEASLGSGDLLLRAKLDYNLGNTLRGLSEGSKLPLLREAEGRYRLALDLFRKHAPNLVAAGETAVASITQQRALAERLAGMASGLAELQTIEAQASSGDEEGAAAALKAFAASAPSAESAVQGLGQELDMMAATLGLPVGFVQAAKEQFYEEAAKVGLGASAPMRAIFGQLESRYRADVSSGKVSAARQEVIESTIAQLRDLLVEQPHEDPTAMASWLARMRALMGQFVETIENPSSGSQANQTLEGRYARFRAVVSEEERQPQRYHGERDTTGQIFVELAKLSETIARFELGRPAGARRRARPAKTPGGALARIHAAAPPNPCPARPLVA